MLASITPNQIIGIGSNYVSDTANLPANEVKHPVFFYKPISIDPNQNVKIPMEINEIKFESELAVVIDGVAKNITPSEVSQYIFGYTICKGVTTPQLTYDEGY
ncbi:fumarylacetoacetate hydrolase family protein [Lentibacillus amyloliquefaciens]|uniref:fumarylacetoacetate hydrolase family protein n=1 Tax=Lentibacillus amyloliquefaciens TaxID=1472767 RepID=UPI001470215C|nr:fumarylacetoacetate hydrolase family protein [Lentibacillus amyloliquefaciens]